MFFLRGVCTRRWFSRMDGIASVWKTSTGSATSSHTSTHRLPNPTCHTSKYAECRPCVCDQRGRNFVYVCQDFPEFISNCAEQMARCDMADWFYGGPQWSHRHCDQLCLPPAVGQGSYNRRLGGPGPLRTALQLSRCGEGTGRGGLGSATVEERSNEVPGDGPMNHYQFCYFRPHQKCISAKSRCACASNSWRKSPSS